MNEPSIGLIECSSIARGITTADAMVKRSPVRLLEARTVCPGKFIILISGEVDRVKEAMDEGRDVAGATVIDELFLPNAHRDLPAAIVGATEVPGVEAVGIIETFSVASTILAADAAAKAADVRLMELRLASGLGGKSFLTLTGAIHDVEAAVAAGCGAVAGGLLLGREVIPAPHPDLAEKLR